MANAILHSSVGKALVTGSAGLIGSACVRALASEDWDVIGLDNDMRHKFFGPEANTAPVLGSLLRDVTRYQHRDVDIRNRHMVGDVIAAERPDFVIHTAAQPSHDKAASIPYDDFDVNEFTTRSNRWGSKLLASSPKTNKRVRSVSTSRSVLTCSGRRMPETMM